jgi:chromosome segregation ATPase
MTDTTEKKVTISGAGIDNLVSKLVDLVETATYALEAYTKDKVLDLQIEELPEVRQLRKDVRIADLRERKSNLEKKKARLEHEIRVLESKRDKLERGVQPGKPVKPAMQTGSKEVPREAAHRQNRSQPLTSQPFADIKDKVTVELKVAPPAPPEAKPEVAATAT